jgi:hypothetical protein
MFYFSYGAIDDVKSLVLLLSQSIETLLRQSETHTLHIAAHSFGGVLLGLALDKLLARAAEGAAGGVGALRTPAAGTDAPPAYSVTYSEQPPPAYPTGAGQTYIHGLHLPQPPTTASPQPQGNPFARRQPPAQAVPSAPSAPPAPPAYGYAASPARGQPNTRSLVAGLSRIRAVLLLDCPLAGVDVPRCKAFATAKAGLLVTSARNMAQDTRRRMEEEGAEQEREIQRQARAGIVSPHAAQVLLAEHRQDLDHRLRQYDRRNMWLGAAVGAAALFGGAYGVLKGLVPLLQAHGAGLRLLTERQPEDQSWLARGRAAFSRLAAANASCSLTHIRVQGCPEHGHWLRPFELENVRMLEWDAWQDGSVAVARFDRIIQNHRHMLHEREKIRECLGHLGCTGWQR